MRETLVDDEYMLLEVEWLETIPTLHLSVHKWSHTLLKNYFFPKWLEVQDYLRSCGSHVVLAVIPASEKKIAKFHAIMGMHEAVNNGVHIVSRRWL